MPCGVEPPGVPMSVRIDVATADDADAVVEMWLSLAVGQRSYGSHLLAEANSEQIRDAIARHIVLDGIRVARIESTESDAPSDALGGVVRNLYVRPDHRGDGVGATLLEAAEAALDDAGADVVTLEAMEANDRARSFYAQQGYEPHRIEFEKPLGDADGNDTHTRED